MARRTPRPKTSIQFTWTCSVSSEPPRLWSGQSPATRPPNPNPNPNPRPDARCSFRRQAKAAAEQTAALKAQSKDAQAKLTAAGKEASAAKKETKAAQKEADKAKQVSRK